MTTKARWNPVEPLEVAKTLIQKIGNEEAKALLNKTYDIIITINKRMLTLIQKDIDQNVLITSSYSKKILDSLFFLQKYRYTADHRPNAGHRIKKFYVQS